MTDEYGYARRLFEALLKKHYPESAATALPDLMGVLTQIDNLTTGLTRQPTQSDCEVAASIRSALYRVCSNMPNYPNGIVEPFVAAHHRHGYDQGYYDGITHPLEQRDALREENERLREHLISALDTLKDAEVCDDNCGPCNEAHAALE